MKATFVIHKKACTQLGLTVYKGNEKKAVYVYTTLFIPTISGFFLMPKHRNLYLHIYIPAALVAQTPTLF